MATSQLNLDSLHAGRRSNSEANMATTQRKGAVFDKQTWPPHSLARGKYLTNKRGHLTASAVVGFKLWGGHVSFWNTAPAKVFAQKPATLTLCDFGVTQSANTAPASKIGTKPFARWNSDF